MLPETPVVYVVQEPKFRGNDGTMHKANILPAVDFGSLELLLEDSDQFNALNGRILVRRLKAKLQYYREQDFILASGDPVAIGVACALAARATRGKFTVLKWDKQERKYYPVIVNLDVEMLV